MKRRSIVRIYQAIVNGLLIAGGTIDAPIGRHPIQRKRMAVTDSGKEAITTIASWKNIVLIAV